MVEVPVLSGDIHEGDTSRIILTDSKMCLDRSTRPNPDVMGSQRVSNTAHFHLHCLCHYLEHLGCLQSRHGPQWPLLSRKSISTKEDIQLRSICGKPCFTGQYIWVGRSD